MSDVDLEWLETPEGREWLEKQEGTAWVTGTDEGQTWARSARGEEWFDEIAQRGWESYFAGRWSPVAGDEGNWITPESAPRIGTRVRLAKTETTMGGTTLEEGELGIVAEMKLAPAGMVWLRIRTPDGRTFLTSNRDGYVPA